MNLHGGFGCEVSHVFPYAFRCKVVKFLWSPVKALPWLWAVISAH